MVRKGGTVNFFGGPPSGTVVGLDTNRLHYGDITLKASFHHTPVACATAFDLICSGEFKCDDFITSTAGLDEVPAVFARMVTRSLDNIADIKTAVFPNGYRPQRGRR
jgi:L-iditol 2-dehydrogenase